MNNVGELQNDSASEGTNFDSLLRFIHLALTSSCSESPIEHDPHWPACLAVDCIAGKLAISRLRLSFSLPLGCPEAFSPSNNDESHPEIL